MAKLEVSPELLAGLVFGFAPNPVKVVGAHFDGRREVVVFDVEGDDVPQAERITCVVSQETNRAGDRFRRMTFKAAE